MTSARAFSNPGSRPGRRARAVIGVVLGGVLVAALGACSSSGDGDAASSDGANDSAADSADSGDARFDAALPEEAAATGADLTSGATGASAPGDTDLDIDLDTAQGRDIIRTGTVSLVTDEPGRTRDDVVDVVTGLGGYVSDESASSRVAAGSGEIRLVLQVPTARFDIAVERVSALGRVTSRTTTAEDVTGQVADVTSRVESARAALERIRALLDQANSLGTVIRLEGVLSHRQADLEALLAQQAALAGQTTMATLEVAVQGDRPAAAPGPDSDETRGFVDGLKAGWDGLQGAFVATSTVVGAVLPFGVLAALVGIPVLVWRRRVSPQH